MLGSIQGQVGGKETQEMRGSRGSQGSRGSIEAIHTIESAGRYLVDTRELRPIVRSGITAVQSAKHSDPDLQALALLSVLLNRIVHTNDGEWWAQQICKALRIPEVK